MFFHQCAKGSGAATTFELGMRCFSVQVSGAASQMLQTSRAREPGSNTRTQEKSKGGLGKITPTSVLYRKSKFLVFTFLQVDVDSFMKSIVGESEPPRKQQGATPAAGPGGGAAGTGPQQAGTCGLPLPTAYPNGGSVVQCTQKVQYPKEPEGERRQNCSSG